MRYLYYLALFFEIDQWTEFSIILDSDKSDFYAERIGENAAA